MIWSYFDVHNYLIFSAAIRWRFERVRHRRGYVVRQSFYRRHVCMQLKRKQWKEIVIFIETNEMAAYEIHWVKIKYF